MEWRGSCGEEAWISSFLLRDRCRDEEEDEEEIAREMVSLSCCREHELGTSIFRVSLDSIDLSLSFIVLISIRGKREPQTFSVAQSSDESFNICLRC